VSFFAIPDAVRLDNPKLMLWRELQQHGDEALQKSNKRWLVLGLRPKDHDSRVGFWRVCLDIREIQVINTRSSARQRSESTESGAPESFSSETVSASKPAHGSTCILLEDSRRL
jgi:hypothetical protein